MKFKPFIYCLVGSVLLGLAAAPRATFADAKGDLKARFAARLPQLRQYKDTGKVGETAAGMVDAVKSAYLNDPQVKKLIAEENADRNQLYQILAAETSTSPQVVAER